MSPRRSHIVLIALLAGAFAGCPAVARPRRVPGWQALIVSADRTRLRGWRDAWREGLGQARAAGYGLPIDAAGALLDPDAALPEVALPDGAYRCRTFKLGTQAAGGPVFRIVPAQACRVAAGSFLTLDGMQRPAGRLWSADPSRLIFLGAMALGDERRALDYGRDGERDMVGAVERVAERRWRLILPRPHWQSLIDVVEIVPADG